MGLHHVLPVSLAKVFTSDSIFVNPGLDTVRFRFRYSLKPFKISAPVLHRSLQAKECIILFVSVSLKRYREWLYQIFWIYILSHVQPTPRRLSIILRVSRFASRSVYLFEQTLSHLGLRFPLAGSIVFATNHFHGRTCIQFVLFHINQIAKFASHGKKNVLCACVLPLFSWNGWKKGVRRSYKISFDWLIF